MDKYEFIESLRDCSQSSSASSYAENINKIEYLKEIINQETRDSHNDSVALNVAMRSYYHLLKRFELDDKEFDEIFIESIETNVIDVKDYLILHSRLQIDQWSNLDIQRIAKKCLNDFHKAAQHHHPALLIILKSLNLLYKKRLTLQLPKITLDDVYFCLQVNEGDMRQQILVLFDNICASKALAAQYFQCTVCYLPWTNKNKYYILGVILNNYSISELLSLTDRCSNNALDRFLDGLRSSLACESLLVPSAFLVKAMSVSSTKAIVEVSLRAITNGSIKEIQNFQIYWFPNVEHKDMLFEALELYLNLPALLKDSRPTNFYPDMFNIRLIFICNMFSKEVLQSVPYRLYFLDYIMSNCLAFDVKIQFEIFRFVVQNLMHLNIVESLEFIFTYIERHKSIECPKIRSDILNKIPTIVNYLINLYNNLQKTSRDSSNPIEIRIIDFFKNLEILIEENIQNLEYQKRIFSLKLLEHILKSLNLLKHRRAKQNLSPDQHRQHLLLLIERNDLFNCSKIWMKLFRALNNPNDFNDTRSVIIHLLNSMEAQVSTSQIIEICEQFCKDLSIDNCLLAPVFARLVTSRLNESNSNEEDVLSILEGILADLTAGFEVIENDPFAACKLNGSHLFGYLGVLNVLAESQMKYITHRLENILHIVERIVNGILQMLNLSSAMEFTNVYCLSFQHMYESLNVLVEKSQCKYENRSEAITYLQLSFWLTLKAGCELAATIGCHIIESNTTRIPANVQYFERCFRLIESVLIKCRHKGAIESAAQCLGKQVKSLSIAAVRGTGGGVADAYTLINESMEHLFAVDGKGVSTTRRGAGFSKMFLHILRNESPQSKRPILERSLNNLMEILRKIPNKMQGETLRFFSVCNTNFDNIQALALHYLCFLIQDAELNGAMRRHYEEILMIILNLIDHPEWTVCNAALQLFAALTCKIVGQRQAVKLKELYSWETTDITFMEILRKFPAAFAYMLDYIISKKSSTQAIVLFLEFLHKIENFHDYLEEKDSLRNIEQLRHCRYIMWCLLSHSCAKVRRLAAICFVRLHKFANELPQILYQISEIIGNVRNVNFLEGLLNTLIEGILKIRCETEFMCEKGCIDDLENIIRDNLRSQLLSVKIKQSYLNCKIIDLLIVLNFDMMEIQLISSRLAIKADTFGSELWLKYTNLIEGNCLPHIEAFDLIETIRNTNN